MARPGPRRHTTSVRIRSLNNNNTPLSLTFQGLQAAPLGGLVIFQQMKQDKNATPKQTIPFHLMFNGARQLTLEYTVPNASMAGELFNWQCTQYRHGDWR
jgi:hypothetical protein